MSSLGDFNNPIVLSSDEEEEEDLVIIVEEQHPIPTVMNGRVQLLARSNTMTEAQTPCTPISGVSQVPQDVWEAATALSPKTSAALNEPWETPKRPVQLESTAAQPEGFGEEHVISRRMMAVLRLTQIGAPYLQLCTFQKGNPQPRKFAVFHKELSKWSENMDNVKVMWQEVADGVRDSDYITFDARLQLKVRREDNVKMVMQMCDRKGPRKSFLFKDELDVLHELLPEFAVTMENAWKEFRAFKFQSLPSLKRKLDLASHGAEEDESRKKRLLIKAVDDKEVTRSWLQMMERRRIAALFEKTASPEISKVAETGEKLRNEEYEEPEVEEHEAFGGHKSTLKPEDLPTPDHSPMQTEQGSSQGSPPSGSPPLIPMESDSDADTVDNSCIGCEYNHPSQKHHSCLYKQDY